MIGISSLLHLSAIHLIKSAHQLSAPPLLPPHLYHMDPAVAVQEPHDYHSLVLVEAGEPGGDFSWLAWEVRVQKMATFSTWLLPYFHMLNYPFPPIYFTQLYGDAATISYLKSFNTVLHCKLRELANA